MSSLAKSSGFSAPFCSNCWMTPGCAVAATSGGLPPSTAVPSTVGTLSPAEVYLTFTFGYFCWKPSRTAWKDFCSSPLQTPTTDTLPETLVSPDAEVEVVLLSLLPPLSLSSPPHPATAISSAPSSASTDRRNR